MGVLSPTQAYRTDMEGLRAISVLFVVLYHAVPDTFSGGFIGVDSFFVISGFLITTILLRNKTFSIVDFYCRRIRRIFPALIMLILFCAVFGGFVLLPNEYRLLGKHMVAAAFFVSNMAFLNEAGYFNSAAEVRPLLHLWSLGLEEQFYLLWPLVVYALRRQRRVLLGGSLVLAAISFALNVYKIGSDTVFAFYLPPTRFWELLAGCVIAQVYFFQPEKRRHRHWDHGLAVIGLGLLVFGFFHITNLIPCLGFWMTIPVLGSACIIMSGPDAWVNRAILSNPMAVWFGRISYPLYLWHWPLLAFSRAMDLDGTAHAGSLALSVVLAWLTYRYLEQPVRQGWGGRRTAWLLGVSLLGMGAVGGLFYTTDGLPSRFDVLAPENKAKLIKLGPVDKGDSQTHRDVIQHWSLRRPVACVAI